MLLVRDLRMDERIKALPMIESFCKEGNYPFDKDSCMDFMERAILSGWMLKVVEDRSALVGMGGVMLAPHYTHRFSLQAVEFVWNSIPSLPSILRAKIMILLLKEMEKFAQDKNAPLVVGTRNTGSLDKYLLRSGYHVTEVFYSKEDKLWRLPQEE